MLLLDDLETLAPWPVDGELLRCCAHMCTPAPIDLRLQLARAVGCSNYGPLKLRDIHSDLARRGVPLASNQFQFSLLSRQPMDNGLIETCQELGVAPIGYSPLGLGLLSGKFTGNLEVDAAALPRGPRGFLFKQVRGVA